MSAVSGGRIPESFIQSVIAKTDIVSLIQESVKLKKAGANYSACCPFHSEKTPSFTVSPAKQFFHCFGCGAHGDAIHFMMQNESLSFMEALEKLALRHGLTVPKASYDPVKSEHKSQVNTVLSAVADFYAYQLKHHASAQNAIDYLKKRGLTGKLAKTFLIGFAPPGWDNLLSHFKNQPESLKILEETGLIIKHPQGRYYDRFRYRIMFPIRSRRGEILGFGGRVLDQSQPKYLNSPESAIFQKSHCLYGVYETLKSKAKWQTAIVVEGYFDVVMLAQHGIYGAFATLGTAITPSHLTNLFGLVSEVVFCFDGDNAGQAAAWKALQLVLPTLIEGRQARFVFLPQGEDPDSYVRHMGEEHFRNLIKNAMPLSEYFFATLCEKVPPNSVDNRAQLASMARPLIEQIPAGILKEMMFEKLAQIAMSSPQVVRGQKANRYVKGTYTRQNTPAASSSAPPPQLMPPAFIASALLIQIPTLYETLKNKDLPSHISAPGIKMLREVLDLLQQDPLLDTQGICQQLIAKGWSEKQLQACEKKVSSIPTSGWEAEFLGAINRLVVIGQEQVAENLLQKAKTTELSQEEKNLLKKILQSGESIS